MRLLKSIAAGVGHEEAAVVISYAFGFVTDLNGGDDLESRSVDFGDEPFGKFLVFVADAAFVTVGRNVDIVAVRGELAVIGHVLGGGDSLAVGGDELDDIRPVDGNCDQIVVDRDDVVGRVAELRAVDVAEPLVADDLAVLEIGDLAVV